MDIVKRDYEKQIKTADFLQRRESWRGDIITNPPYKYAAEFVQHALDIIDNGQKVAMFLKLTFLEGEKRRALNGNAADFKKSSAVCYAWFVWEKGSQQKPVIDWI